MKKNTQKIIIDFTINILVAFAVLIVILGFAFIFNKPITSETQQNTNDVIASEKYYEIPLTLPEEFTIQVDEITLPETSATTIIEETNTYENLGKFKLTAYCPCSKCCDKWGENRPVDENGDIIVYTASGEIAEQGRTIAADTNVLPFGTIIYIDGKEYEVQDRGGAIKNKRIDIYFDDHQEALNFGVQYAEVFVAEIDTNFKTIRS